MKLQRKELRKVNWKVFYYLLRSLVLYFYTTIYTYDYYLMLIILFKLTHLPTYQHYLYPELGLSLEVKTV